MTDDDDEPTYIYKSTLIGGAARLTLKRDGLDWEVGRRSGFLRYDKMRAVRLSYKPVTMQCERG